MPLTVIGSCLTDQRLTGVNLAGAEFNSSKLPGEPNKDYVYPDEKELRFIARQGANVIRLPFRWERIQTHPGGPLALEELKRLQETVTDAHKNGLCVILDVHNYAKYYNQPLQNNPELQTAFVDLWLRLAAVFSDVNATAFGLMNEPNYMDNAQWAELAKRTLLALRNAASTNVVFIAGGHWSGLHDWFNKRDGVSNADAFADLQDPLKRTFVEVHQYADSDHSGTHGDCISADTFNKKFQSISAWAQQNKQRLFLGEFGVPATAECLVVLERFLNLTKENMWKGWSYWAAGRWWGSYPLAINTNDEQPSAQWRVLKKYFAQAHMGKSPTKPSDMLITPAADNQ